MSSANVYLEVTLASALLRTEGTAELGLLGTLELEVLHQVTLAMVRLEAQQALVGASVCKRNTEKIVGLKVVEI